MPGKLVLSTTPFSRPQQNSLLICFLQRHVPTPALLRRYWEKQLWVLQGQWARKSHRRAVSIKQESTSGRDNETPESMWRGRAILNLYQQLWSKQQVCACCVHVTAMSQLCLWPGWLVMSQQPEEKFPSPSPPLTGSDSRMTIVKTHNSLLTWPKQSLKWRTKGRTEFMSQTTKTCSELNLS